MSTDNPTQTLNMNAALNSTAEGLIELIDTLERREQDYRGLADDIRAQLDALRDRLNGAKKKKKKASGKARGPYKPRRRGLPHEHAPLEGTAPGLGKMDTLLAALPEDQRLLDEIDAITKGGLHTPEGAAISRTPPPKRNTAAREQLAEKGVHDISDLPAGTFAETPDHKPARTPSRRTTTRKRR